MLLCLFNYFIIFYEKVLIKNDVLVVFFFMHFIIFDRKYEYTNVLKF